MKKLLTIASVMLLASAAFSQNWIEAESGLEPTVLYADTTNDLLYIGGDFKCRGKDTLNGICYWDGKQVYGMKGGRYDQCGNSCAAMKLIISYKGEIYISQLGDSIGGKLVHGAARWNGTEWNPLGKGLKSWSSSGAIIGACVYQDILYVAGYFRTAGGDTCNSIAAWDGERWSSLGFPRDTLLWNGPPFMYTCAYYKGELYFGGNCLNNIGGYANRGIARYDGMQWKRVGPGLKGGYTDIRGMVVYKDELYVCGYFPSAAGNAGNKIMRWDGEQWKSVGGGLCSQADIAEGMVVHKDKLYVYGIFNCVDNGLPAENIAAWDGEKWCSLGRSDFNNKILTAASWRGELYIGGGFTKIDGQPVSYFAKWVGDHATDTCSRPIVSAHELPVPPPAPLYISPNPADHQVLLALLEEQASAPVHVYDAQGRCVWAGQVQGSVNIDVSTWPSGIYVAEIGGVGVRFVVR